MAYAEEVTKYNGAITSGGGYGIKPNLVEKFSALFPEEREQEIALMWDIVKAMTGIPGKRAISQIAKYIFFFVILDVLFEFTRASVYFSPWKRRLS